MHRLRRVYPAVKAVGATYLIWIGVKMVVGARKPLPPARQHVGGGRGAVRKAYPVSMTNPKSFTFYGSILTVMVPVGAASWFYVTVALIAILVSAAWYGGLAILFSHGSARRVFAKAKVGVEATMGAILIGTGGKLLLSHEAYVGEIATLTIGARTSASPPCSGATDTGSATGHMPAKLKSGQRAPGASRRDAPTSRSRWTTPASWRLLRQPAGGRERQGPQLGLVARHPTRPGLKAKPDAPSAGWGTPPD